ncbi:UNVERIFIED_CONTAM: hypothetical protein Slati_4601300 [Sesamum latifolium]|uniref:Uncharacterized protein n=1 Tax=Sesamum latifolium TaxID=2727402 RepID=A0AAW2S2Y3_9LAMI
MIGHLKGNSGSKGVLVVDPFDVEGEIEEIEVGVGFDCEVGMEVGGSRPAAGGGELGMGVLGGTGGRR